ncbi:unnamed protein product [Moneuplotes crassus]|uniref:Double-strand break repair protein n=1 Tax=Euplotes crassus TaxID=5936 RepID=A0AAD2DB82_EUPCR|nr:unnamed protein product [Moneuplotes crassus]
MSDPDSSYNLRSEEKEQSLLSELGQGLVQEEESADEAEGEEQEEADSEERESEVSDTDVFKIFISTDNHLGYKEGDPIREDDSFEAFDEVLQKASNDETIDFLLLGGDLFHEKKPSRNTFLKTFKMLNSYVMGDQDIRFKTKNFQANYMDPSISIKLPIFIIHGNHDDPCGLEHQSNIDMICTNKLVNYFGKVRNIEEIVVEPILLTKGQTKIALYGIGHMKDERLNIAFEKKKITFRRPKNDPESWFNILVLHQNRYKGDHVGVSRRESIAEDTIPGFINFVLWAHEHECIPTPYKCDSTGVYFLQAGSTVQTSLIEAESKPKMGFVLQVFKTAFQLNNIPLETVRPLVYQHIEMSDSNIDSKDKQKIENYLCGILNKMIEKANILYKNRPQRVSLPLIMLKVECTGYDLIHSRKIAHHFQGKIANVTRFILPHKRILAGNSRADKIIAEAAFNKAMGLKAGTSVLEELDRLNKSDNPQFDGDTNERMLHDLIYDSFTKKKMLHIVPRDSFIQELENYVNSNDNNSLRDYFTVQVYKEAHTALMTILKRNNGVLCNEDDPGFARMDEKILEIARNHLKLRDIELSGSYFTPKKKFKTEEEIIEDADNLQTNIDNKVNEKKARERKAKYDILNNTDMETPIQKDDLKYGPIDFEKHQDSEEEDLKQRRDQLLGGGVNKRKRSNKRNFKREIDENDITKNLPNTASKFRAKPGHGQKSQKSQKERISRFQKDTKHRHQKTKTKESDFASKTIKNREKNKEIEVEEIID